jgi:twitching motility protein PilT
VAEWPKTPDLDDLVRQLNREAEAAQGPSAPAAGAPDPVASGPQIAPLAVPTLEAERGKPVSAQGALGRILAEMHQRQASDALLVAREKPALRVDGRLLRSGPRQLSAEDIVALFRPLMSPEQRQELAAQGAADFSIRLEEGAAQGGGARFRVNVHRQRGSLAAAIRALPLRIPTVQELGLPASLEEQVRPGHGLVLICGPTGAGKSTTLAALVGAVNRQRPCHIITIEAPVEFEHESLQAVVEHVEVGRDAPSFKAALRSALRQDPDVILVGEMRDLDTIATALTAAETGHLVLSTLHTSSAVRAVDRIVDVFPEGSQPQVRQQLAQGLRAIFSQKLLPRADGQGRVPAGELLVATYPVRHLIRRGESSKLYNEITLGSRFGMVTMEASLAQLVRQGLLSREEARLRANHPEELESHLDR